MALSEEVFCQSNTRARARGQELEEAEKKQLRWLPVCAGTSLSGPVHEPRPLSLRQMQARPRSRPRGHLLVPALSGVGW